MYPISVLAYQWKSPFLPRCLKVTEKVSFNNASEASYVYILSGQKLLLKSPPKGPFWRVKLENLINTGHL